MSAVFKTRFIEYVLSQLKGPNNCFLCSVASLGYGSNRNEGRKRRGTSIKGVNREVEMCSITYLILHTVTVSDRQKDF